MKYIEVTKDIFAAGLSEARGDFALLHEDASALKSLLLDHCQGAERDNAEYVRLRRRVLSSVPEGAELPSIVQRNRSLDEVRDAMYGGPCNAHEMRVFLQTQFDPILTFLEGRAAFAEVPTDEQVLKRIDVSSVHEIWRRATQRCESEPQGALTLAQTLIETVCKHILEKLVVEYDNRWDAVKLYNTVATRLGLHPKDQVEKCFKEILGACHKIVDGLSSTRNNLGDAHGKGMKSYKAQPRHARFAVGVAGATAVFLFETWEARSAGSLSGTASQGSPSNN